MHFITDLDVGGTELMLTRLLPFLKQHFDTQVVCAMNRGRVGALLERKGVSVTYLNLRHWFDVGIIYRFYRVVRHIQPDILITHLIHPDIFGRIFGKLFGIKHVICSQQGSLLQWEWLRTIDRLTAGFVDLYIVQTEIARQDLVRRLRVPVERFVVIPNSVLPHLPLNNIENLSQELNIPPHDVRIICVSRLRRGKGHEYLLQAFAELTHRHDHLSLLLAGDGERELALREQAQALSISSRVHFLGNRSDIPSLLEYADVFVLPTLAEGMSNAILEAMAAGRPCVVSNIPVNQALIKHNSNGLVFETANTADLTNKLERLILDPDLRKQLGQQAKTDIQDEFSLTTVGKKWINVLNQIG